MVWLANRKVLQNAVHMVFSHFDKRSWTLRQSKTIPLILPTTVPRVRLHYNRRSVLFAQFHWSPADECRPQWFFIDNPHKLFQNPITYHCMYPLHFRRDRETFEKWSLFFVKLLLCKKSFQYIGWPNHALQLDTFDCSATLLLH